MSAPRSALSRARPKSRLDVAVRREEILRATLEQIEARGLAEVRVGDVAAALGVSSGLVFYHFSTKDALVAAALMFAVQSDLDRLDAALSKGDSAAERVRTVIVSYGPTGRARGWRLWIDAWSTALHAPLVRASLGYLDKRWRAALVSAIHAGVDAGEFACDDAEATAARLAALLDGLSIAAIVYRNVTRKQLRTWVCEAAAVELGLPPNALG